MLKTTAVADISFHFKLVPNNTQEDLERAVRQAQERYDFENQAAAQFYNHAVNVEAPALQEAVEVLQSNQPDDFYSEEWDEWEEQLIMARERVHFHGEHLRDSFTERNNRLADLDNDRLQKYTAWREALREQEQRRDAADEQWQQQAQAQAAAKVGAMQAVAESEPKQEDEEEEQQEEQLEEQLEEQPEELQTEQKKSPGRKKAAQTEAQRRKAKRESKRKERALRSEQQVEADRAKDRERKQQSRLSMNQSRKAQILASDAVAHAEARARQTEEQRALEYQHARERMAILLALSSLGGASGAETPGGCRMSSPISSQPVD